MHLISQTNEPHHEIEHVKISNTARFQSCRPNMCRMTDIWSQCMVSSTARPPVIHVSYFQVCPISFISSGYDLLLWSVVVSPSHSSSFPFLTPLPLSPTRPLLYCFSFSPLEKQRQHDFQTALMTSYSFYHEFQGPLGASDQAHTVVNTAWAQASLRKEHEQ